MEFSDDEASYDEDRQWMVGNAILVKPIVEPNAVQASLYLAGKREIWYDWETSRPRPSPGAVQNPATLKTIPMYQRGGDFANGTIYLDDGETYSYKKGEYAYWGIIFKK
ncbi:hypothetical protein ANCDUO_08893 [Ancylostoma duodenale]|uniref:Glycosyl hydrolase family 31 C-terminal domain-containing protein n=1 Tax=Ancylostoma duodenale TaxID=51022 RepID=A0A0C2CVC6_9BILA|nr:hypothetical protein ANCDUO_08893 [Ancylostoma duodenale]